MEFRKKKTIFPKGDLANAVLYIQEGRVKLSVVNENGKTTLPKISQEVLAEMIGATRSRVNFFMNKFKKRGFIKYDGGLQINTSLLSVLLHDE